MCAASLTMFYFQIKFRTAGSRFEPTILYLRGGTHLLTFFLILMCANLANEAGLRYIT